MSGLILDTNLLCLLAVGRLDPNLINRHRRLRAYSQTDYFLLVDIVSHFQSLITTPHILAETSNLLRQTAEPLSGYACNSLAEIVASSDERHHPAVKIIDRPEFLRLGMTDAAILVLLADGHHLVSADLDLYLAGASAGYSAINFNHVRDGAVYL